MLPADSPFAPLPAPGPHPATAELRAYAAGTLPPADEHRIEAHTLDCERCADLVAGFSMSDAATTAHAVAALRSRLQTRVGGPKARPADTRWAWPRLAAAAALLGVVASSLWVWEQRETPTTATVARQETTPPPAAVAPPVASEATAEAQVDDARSAVVMRAPARRLRPARSARRATAAATKPVAAADAESSKMASAADEAKQTGLVAQAQPTTARSARVAPEARTPAPAMSAPAPVLSEQEAAGFPDSAASSTAKMSRMAQDKVLAIAEPAMQNAATARVAASPMPAGPAILPAPVGGTGALREYIRKEVLAFVPEDGNRPLTGVVRIKFVVGADGKLSNLKVTRGLRADYDAEALRMVCEGPAWQPGVSAGRRAPLPMEISVPF